MDEEANESEVSDVSLENRILENTNVNTPIYINSDSNHNDQLMLLAAAAAVSSSPSEDSCKSNNASDNPFVNSVESQHFSIHDPPLIRLSPTSPNSLFRQARLDEDFTDITNTVHTATFNTTNVEWLGQELYVKRDNPNSGSNDLTRSALKKHSRTRCNRHSQTGTGRDFQHLFSNNNNNSNLDVTSGTLTDNITNNTNSISTNNNNATLITQHHSNNNSPNHHHHNNNNTNRYNNNRDLKRKRSTTTNHDQLSRTSNSHNENQNYLKRSRSRNNLWHNAPVNFNGDFPVQQHLEPNEQTIETIELDTDSETEPHAIITQAPQPNTVSNRNIDPPPPPPAYSSVPRVLAPIPQQNLSQSQQSSSVDSSNGYLPQQCTQVSSLIRNLLPRLRSPNSHHPFQHNSHPPPPYYPNVSSTSSTSNTIQPPQQQRPFPLLQSQNLSQSHRHNMGPFLRHNNNHPNNTNRQSYLLRNQNHPHNSIYQQSFSNSSSSSASTRNSLYYGRNSPTFTTDLPTVYNNNNNNNSTTNTTTNNTHLFNPWHHIYPISPISPTSTQSSNTTAYRSNIQIIANSMNNNSNNSNTSNPNPNINPNSNNPNNSTNYQASTNNSTLSSYFFTSSVMNDTAYQNERNMDSNSLNSFLRVFGLEEVRQRQFHPENFSDFDAATLGLDFRDLTPILRVPTAERHRFFGVNSMESVIQLALHLETSWRGISPEELAKLPTHHYKQQQQQQDTENVDTMHQQQHSPVKQDAAELNLDEAVTTTQLDYDEDEASAQLKQPDPMQQLHKASIITLDDISAECGVVPPLAKKPRTTKLIHTEQDRCMVCLEEFNDDDHLRSLTCGHHYHVICIDKWLKINRTCPMCRADAVLGLAGYN